MSGIAPTAAAPSYMAGLRGRTAQRAALENFVRIYFDGDVGALVTRAMSTGFYAAAQPRSIVRWRMERTIKRLNLAGGDGQ